MSMWSVFLRRQSYCEHYPEYFLTPEHLTLCKYCLWAIRLPRTDIMETRYYYLRWVKITDRWCAILSHTPSSSMCVHSSHRVHVWSIFGLSCPNTNKTSITFTSNEVSWTHTQKNFIWIPKSCYYHSWSNSNVRLNILCPEIWQLKCFG